MSPQLFRIDDRLIHGQVVIGWVSSLGSHQIILCDDAVAGSDWESELYLSVVPEPLQARVLSVAETAKVLQAANGLDKSIVLVGSPLVAEQLQKLNALPGQVNIGGLHFRAGREKYLDYLYLSAEERAACMRLLQKGIALYCQDVPAAECVDLARLFY